MKKLLFFFFLFSNVVYADEVTIMAHKNPEHRIIVSYQICPLTLKEPHYCDPMEIAIINANNESITIPVYNWAYFVNIIHVLEEDKQGNITNKAHFVWKDFCNGYYNHPLNLVEDGTDHIKCSPG